MEEVHVVTESPIPVDFPATQLLQLVSPEDEDHFPTGHNAHAVLLEVTYVPARQVQTPCKQVAAADAQGPRPGPKQRCQTNPESKSPARHVTKSNHIPVAILSKEISFIVSKLGLSTNAKNYQRKTPQKDKIDDLFQV